MENKAIYSLRIKVRDYEIDSEGIVNNARYLNYFEHTRHEFCREVGLPFREMLRRGMSPVVRHVSIDYLKSLGPGDEFDSRLTLSRKGARFIFHQWIEDMEGDTVASADITIVNLIGGKLTRGDELAEAFGSYIS